MQTNQPARSRSGSETRKKSTPVTSRYDDDELRELDEAASRAGLTRASFQRVQSLDEPRTRSTRRPSIEKELLARTLGQLGKIGSNLNQIAKAANTSGEDRGIEAAARDVQEAARAVMRALGRQE